MSNYSQFSERLIAALELSGPPVAVTFSDQVVANHSAPIEPVAAGCKFWEQAMTQALATTAADHANCAIGIHTHNLKGAPESQPTELEDTLAAMRGLDYVRPDEVAAIPVMPLFPVVKAGSSRARSCSACVGRVTRSRSSRA